MSAEPREPTASFKGTLRDYQKGGLGWFEALRGLGFGGCLADEMGLGKTIQVLAMLLQRKIEQMESAKRVENLYEEAIKAFRMYSGQEDDEGDGDDF